MGCKFIQTRRNQTNQRNRDRKVNGALRRLRRDKFNQDKIKYRSWNEKLIGVKMN